MQSSGLWESQLASILEPDFVGYSQRFQTDIPSLGLSEGDKDQNPSPPTAICQVVPSSPAPPPSLSTTQAQAAAANLDKARRAA